jgi:phage terminase large subunit GpA-like protein
MPPPKLTVSQWADQYRQLSSEASAAIGQWRTDDAPYQREIMDAWDDPTVKGISWMKSSQVGATEVLNNIIGKTADKNPAPILLIQPTTGMAETYSKTRIAPMIRDTPSLNEKFSENKSRYASNTTLEKTFTGGYLAMIGANSPASLASRPVPYVLADEIDRYPVSAGVEGDPISLAKKRSTTFFNAKWIEVSTPTIKGASRIEASFMASDQRYYWVPCPECDEYQILKWSNVQWPEGQPKAAYYCCDHCGCAIQHRQKREMLKRGEWRASAEFNGIAGFWINEVYSPWSTWGQMAENFLASKDDPHLLKTFVNTALGQSWESAGERVDPNHLLSRCEDYGDTLPEGVLVITAGVDVQGDRIECEVVGWGIHNESWSLSYKVFYGSPALADIWQELDSFLLTPYHFENGKSLQIITTCIDSGGNFTSQVYRFCKPREGRRVYAIKGTSVPGAAILHTSSRKNDGNVRLFSLGTEALKELFFCRLAIEEPGPGYCHFTYHNDAKYFSQLTSEERRTEYIKGVARLVYKVIAHRRNEALDCRVYATAACHILNPQYAALSAKLAEKPAEIPVLPSTPTDPVTQAHRQRHQPPPRKKPGGFVNNWR